MTICSFPSGLVLPVEVGDYANAVWFYISVLKSDLSHVKIIKEKDERVLPQSFRIFISPKYFSISGFIIFLTFWKFMISKIMIMWVVIEFIITSILSIAKSYVCDNMGKLRNILS